MGAFVVALVSLAAPSGPPRDEVATAPSRFASFAGMRVHYKLLGAGEPTLVLVHGWTCNLGFWKGQAPLAKSARLVLVDLPGHGQSDKPEITYSMELMARAVDAVLRDSGVARAVLVGHSMGTPVVWQFSRLFPEKTQALVAVDGGFRSSFKTQAERDAWASRNQGKDYKTSMAARLDGLIGRTAAPALRAEIKAEMLKTPEHVAASAAYEMTDPMVYVTEPKIPVPVLGLYAGYWAADYRTTIEKFIPQLDYQTLPGAGHFLMQERPADFNARLLVFLRKQGLLAGP
jgi:pimeloyl-ACP methyl ester carboxylesterase